MHFIMNQIDNHTETDQARDYPYTIIKKIYICMYI